MLFNNIPAVLAVLVSGVLAKDRTECYTAMTTKNAPRYLETKYSTYYRAFRPHLWARLRMSADVIF